MCRQNTKDIALLKIEEHGNVVAKVENPIFKLDLDTGLPIDEYGFGFMSGLGNRQDMLNGKPVTIKIVQCVVRAFYTIQEIDSYISDKYIILHSVNYKDYNGMYALRYYDVTPIIEPKMTNKKLEMLGF